MNISFLCFFISLLYLTIVKADNFRATWISTYENDIKSQSTAVTLLTKLKSLGVTHVYVSIFWQSRLYAHSNAYQTFAGVREADYFGNVLAAADQVGGLKVVGWLEYGLMASYGPPSHPFALKVQSEGWILGEYRGWQWMNPDKFGPLLVNICTDLKNNYQSRSSFGGLQLDDHFGVPSKFNSWFTGGPESRVTTLLRQVSNAIGASNLSISPNIMPHSLRDYNANWPAWMSSNLAFEVIPQTYTASGSQFNSASGKLGAQLRYGVPLSKMVAGIRCEGSGSPTTYNAVMSQIAATRASGIKGYSIWHSGCLTSRYYNNFRQVWNTPTQNNPPPMNNNPPPMNNNPPPVNNNPPPPVNNNPPSGTISRSLVRVSNGWVSRIPGFNVERIDDQASRSSFRSRSVAVNKFLLHTVEGSYPANGDWEGGKATLDRRGVWSHFLVAKDRSGRMRVGQMVSLNVQAKSAFQDGNFGTIQVEIGGLARLPFVNDPELLEPVRALYQAMRALYPAIANEAPLEFLNQSPAGHADGGPQRVRPKPHSLWDNTAGLVGHQHAPNNEGRWDPGPIDPTALFSLTFDGSVPSSGGSSSSPTTGFAIPSGATRCQASSGTGYCTDSTTCPGRAFPWSAQAEAAGQVDASCRPFDIGITCCAPVPSSSSPSSSNTFVIPAGKTRCRASTGVGYCEKTDSCPGRVFPWSQGSTTVDNACQPFDYDVACCAPRGGAAFLEDSKRQLESAEVSEGLPDWAVPVIAASTACCLLICVVLLCVCVIVKPRRQQAATTAGTLTVKNPHYNGAV